MNTIKETWDEIKPTTKEGVIKLIPFLFFYSPPEK